MDTIKIKGMENVLNYRDCISKQIMQVWRKEGARRIVSHLILRQECVIQDLEMSYPMLMILHFLRIFRGVFYSYFWLFNRKQVSKECVQ